MKMTKEELHALREERKRMREEMERRRTEPSAEADDLEYDYWLTLILMDEGATKH